MAAAAELDSDSSVGVDKARGSFTKLVAQAEDGHATRLSHERTGHSALLAPVSRLGSDVVATLRRVSLTEARPRLGALVEEAADGAPCVLERRGAAVAVLLADLKVPESAPVADKRRPKPALLADVLRSTAADEPDAGLSFGMPSLDAAVRGLTAGRLVVLAAAPGAGGSLLAAAAGRTTAIGQQRPVLYAASGLRRDDVAARMVAGHLTLDYQQLRTRTLAPEQQQAADAYAARLHAPLYIDDDSLLTAELVTESASCMGEVALVVVDRLQFHERQGVALSGGALPSAARALVALASRLHVPVLAVLDTDDPQALASLHPDVTLTLTRKGARAEVAVWERDFGTVATVRLHAELARARFTELDATATDTGERAEDGSQLTPVPVLAGVQAKQSPVSEPAGAPAQAAGPQRAATTVPPARENSVHTSAVVAPGGLAAEQEAPTSRRPGDWPAGTARPATAPAPAAAPAAPAPAPDCAVGAVATSAVSAEGVNEQEQHEAPDSSRKSRRFDYGPFAVLDGEGSAYLAGGRSQACKATTLVEMAQWALARPFGTPRATPYAADRDPLIVLMPKAAELLGLPALPDARTRALPVGHPLLDEITDAGWQTTRRGDDPWFSSWPRVYQPMKGAQRERRSVQFAILSWGALSKDGWPLPYDDESGDFTVPVTDVVAFLDAYSHAGTTPVSSAAATSQELMKQLRPRTRPWNYAQPGEQPDVRPAWVKGALHAAVDPAPCEVPPEHPLARDRTDPSQALNEEAWSWWRMPTNAERALGNVVTVDVSCAFGAGANRTTVGLCAPYHLPEARFDKKLPGSWYDDLSQVRIPKGLPNPFTPDGKTPTGPGWYETRSIGYAIELGHRPGLLQAWVRPSAEQAAVLGIAPHPPMLIDPDEDGHSKYPPVPPFGNGNYLTPWYEHLRDGLMATYARLGIDARQKGEDPAAYDQRFLAAMARLEDEEFRARHATDLQVLRAVKATFKSGIGKFRERDRRTGGRSRDPHSPWPALKSPQWRPDIRAAIIARSRVNMHRKILATMEATGAVPLAIRTDAITYASATDDILGLVGHKGGFTLGPNPGYVKPEPVHTMDWYLHYADKNINPASKIKHLDSDGDE
ncbi:type II toxin-antitoxin system Phd/YefM family antitoxin [Streptomyces sp. ISL-98]|uniref:DnaB-like helicase C-terminal domain-containing protein n=1 Tax=Streptomyces sp. ISL-98 TaxID=2819192 RepID=UPI001BE96ED9|nr:DnaB-like helicase C-terminal domain-containing protein [Streptomyces sp. ISL-98]MBT2508537.1 type II toxin-antitoxin system Phd/YefM family antitoxin [Streptomyces sp. ISL-98]